jgi:hypothetical protein
MKSATLLALLLLAAIAAAQPADTLWTRAFGTASDEWAYGVCQILNGDIVTVGKTQTSASTASDALVMRVTSGGDVIGQSTYGGSSPDAFYSVIATADGGFAATGYTQSNGAGGSDVYLQKFSASGSLEWTRYYGGIDNDVGYSVIQTADEGFAVAGSTQSITLNMQMYLVRTNAAGQMLWSRSYGTASTSLAMAICPASGGGFLLAGYSLAGSYAGYIVRTNSAGDTLWTRSDGGATKQLSSATQAFDGGFVIGGWSLVSGSYDYYMMKMNDAGAVQWTRTHGGRNADHARSVIQTTDGGYLLAGYSNSFGEGNFDAYFVKYNSQVEVIWTRSVGGSGDDKMMAATLTSDGGYLGAGMTQSFGQGESGYGDVYLMRLASPLGVGGVIRSVQSQPMANVYVSELGASNYVRSDGQGRYFLPLQPGLHNLITYGPCTARDTLLNVNVLEDTITVLDWTVREPHGFVEQSSLNLVVHNHVSDTAWVRIHNDASGGNSALDYTVIPTTVAPLSNWLTVPAVSGSVPAGSVRDVAVCVRADTTDNGIWDYYGYVTVRFNSCPDSVARVNVIANVLDADRKPDLTVHDYELSAYPNPFNPQTTIHYSIARPESAELAVYDVSGRMVRSLVAGLASTGGHDVSFDASRLPTGIYFVRLQTASVHLTQKIMLLR